MLNPFISMKIDFEGQGGFKMIKRMSIFFFFSILFVCCFVQGSMAQQYETEIYGITAQRTSPLTYSYLPGHEEDPAQIKGFSYDGIILYGGVEVATTSATVTLLEPPLNLTSPFIYAAITETISFLGVAGGTLDVSGYLVAATYTDSSVTGEVIVSRSGSITGTDAFSGIHVLLISWGSANFLSEVPSGSMIQIWRF